MRYIGTEKVVCHACGVELDVPLYQVDGVSHYGMKFCHQCGASLFYESRLISLNKGFIDWLTDKFFLMYCDNSSCDTCNFHRNNNEFKRSCDKLTGDERLAIIKKIRDSE